MDTTDPQPGAAAAGQETHPSPSPADPVAAHQPADNGSSATGSTEDANTTPASLTEELIGGVTATTTTDENAPAGDAPQGDDHKTSANGEQGDDHKTDDPDKDPSPEELAKLPAPHRGRIKNLLAKNSKVAAERDEIARERNTLAQAFQTIDQHLEGVPPEQVTPVLAELGAAIRGDAAAKAAIAKRLGLTAQPAQDNQTKPTADDLDPEIKMAADALDDLGENERAAALRAKFAKPKQEKPAEQQPPTDPAKAAPAPVQSPAFDKGVSEMRKVIADVQQEYASQAPQIVDAIGKRFIQLSSEKEAEVRRMSADPKARLNPAVFGDLMRQAKDAVLRDLSSARKSPPPGSRSSPPAGQSSGSATLTDELINGRP